MRFQTLVLSLLLAVSAAAADRRVVVTTVAGIPGVSGSGDGAQQATFNRPTWLDIAEGGGPFQSAFDGDIFVVDRENDAIRRISGGVVSTVVFRASFLFAGFERLDFGGPFGGGIMIEPRGSGCGSGIYDRGMFIASSGLQRVALLAMFGDLTSRDDVSPVIGTGEVGSRDGRETSAQFSNPTGIARSWRYPNFDSVRGRSVYIADTGNHTIRRLGFQLSFEACPQHRFVETLAGTAGQPGSQDGRGAAARFRSPRGVAAGPDGSVYVTDSDNHTIRRIAPDGTVTTIAGEAGVPGSNDGAGLSAHLNFPSGIDVNANGDLFIADTGNHVIRLLGAGGVMTTLAGLAGVASFADGNGDEARFNGPVGLKIANDGSLYVAETGNHTIRRIVFAEAKKRVVRR